MGEAAASSCAGSAPSVKRRKARIGHKPRTRELVSVDEKTVPSFRASNMLRGRLNRGGMKRLS